MLVNPALAKRMLATMTQREVTVLSKSYVLRLLDATRSTRLGALWNLLAYTGMRPGEALGLQGSDVDLGAGVVRVRRALVPQKQDGTGRTWRLEGPKTEKSRRAIPLLPATVDALKWHLTGQDAEKITAGSAYTEHGFVFASPKGAPLREDVVYKSPLPSGAAGGRSTARDAVRAPAHGSDVDA